MSCSNIGGCEWSQVQVQRFWILSAGEGQLFRLRQDLCVTSAIGLKTNKQKKNFRYRFFFLKNFRYRFPAPTDDIIGATRAAVFPSS